MWTVLRRDLDLGSMEGGEKYASAQLERVCPSVVCEGDANSSFADWAPTALQKLYCAVWVRVCLGNRASQSFPIYCRRYE